MPSSCVVGQTQTIDGVLWVCQTALSWLQVSNGGIGLNQPTVVYGPVWLAFAVGLVIGAAVCLVTQELYTRKRGG